MRASMAFVAVVTTGYTTLRMEKNEKKAADNNGRWGRSQPTGSGIPRKAHIF